MSVVMCTDVYLVYVGMHVLLLYYKEVSYPTHWDQEGVFK